jgi:hypothetical protein
VVQEDQERSIETVNLRDVFQQLSGCGISQSTLTNAKAG